MDARIQKALIPTIVGVAGLSGGGVIGYILGRRRTQQEFMLVAQNLDSHIRAQDSEIDSLKELVSGEELLTSKYIETPAEPTIRYSPEFDDEEIENVVNVFNNDIPGWDWEAELTSRSNKALYVITKEEFFADDMGYRQSTVTWYEGDRTLADEREQPIYNWSSIVGTELPFGHGSGDDNVVYIRNEELRHEYEICRDPSAHGVEVIGFEIEQDYAESDVRHSSAPLKFRRE